MTLTFIVNGAKASHNHVEQKLGDSQDADKDNDESEDEKDDEPSAGTNGGKLLCVKWFLA